MQQLSHRRIVEYTFDNPNATNANWALFVASTYETDLIAYEAVLRCKQNNPNAAVRLSIQTTFI
jgi:hypothetical protein